MEMADDQDLGGTLGSQAGSAAQLETIRVLTDLALTGAETGDPAFDCLGDTLWSKTSFYQHNNR